MRSDRGACKVWFTLVTALLIGVPAFGDATAPVTNHRHEHHHNDKHPVVHDQALIHTNRKGAELDLPTDEPMFTFVVFGDRTGGPNEGIDVLVDAVADANLLEPDLVMTVGDLVNGYNTTPEWLEQMQQFKQVMNELRCPWMPVAGNHDIYWRGGEDKPKGEHETDYEVHFGPLWYAFEHKNCWFIVLYSDEGDPKTGQKTYTKPEAQMMSPEQFEWLKGILEQAKDADHVFLFLHHPRWHKRSYGDDWDKVHEELVKVGNVSAVFAGHIHFMTYDEQDGIEYVALATTGGSQSWRVPEAGSLHEYHVVTVRKNQIALAAIPVGHVMDVRQITSDVVLMTRTLSDVLPGFNDAIAVGDDGSVMTEFAVIVNNPTPADIQIEVTPSSADSRWVVTPDHIHDKLAGGESKTLSFKAFRPDNSLDDYTRPLDVTLAMDLLTDTARYAIPARTKILPGSVALPAPEKPDSEKVLVLNGERGAAVLDTAPAKVHDGPITFECWVMPHAVLPDVGIIAAPGFGISLDHGRPACYVNVDDRFVQAILPNEKTLQVNQSYHLAGEYDGKHLRLYVNGQQVEEVAASGALKLNGQAFTIGADSTPQGPANTMQGWVDAVRVSNIARYQGKAFDHTRSVEADEHTAMLFNMDADQHGYLYDSSGNKAHATLIAPAKIDYMK